MLEPTEKDRKYRQEMLENGKEFQDYVCQQLRHKGIVADERKPLLAKKAKSQKMNSSSKSRKPKKQKQ